MRGARILLGVVLLAALAGCGSSQEEADRQLNSFRRALREQVGLREKMAGILKGVRDQESMIEALKRLDSSRREFERASEQVQRLGEPPPEIRARLEQENARLIGATQEVLAEMRRIADLPGGDAFLEAVKRIAKPERP
jgi:hypothetical protein